jgi:HAMP domain-containing protein
VERLKLLLGLGALAMSLVSVGLMIVLIRRFITNPIAALDRQVTAVMTGKNDGITEIDAAGEIGRLTGNIKQLHDQSQRALHLVQHASWTDTLTGISNRGHFNMLAAKVVHKGRSVRSVSQASATDSTIVSGMVQSSSSAVLISSSPTRPRKISLDAVSQPVWRVIQAMKPSGTRLTSETKAAKIVTQK